MTICEKIQHHIGGCDGILLLDEKNRHYATGFASSAGAVLLTRTENYLITDFRYIEAARKVCTDFTVLEQKGALGRLLAELVQEHRIQTLAFEDAFLTVRRYQNLLEPLGAALHPCSAEMTALRAIKTRAEIERITAAQRMAEKAYEDVLNFIALGKTELEIAAYLEYRMRLHGSQGAAFDTIAVSGPKSSLPHGVPGDKKIEPGDFVTLDFGATCDGYHSDMTRTVAVGHATEKMRKVYDIVLQANLLSHQNIKPGMTGNAADAIAREYIAGQGYDGCFGHGLGHGVGLDIHEEPRFSPSCQTLIEPGNVITIEPGIYLPEEFGVRIEDLVEITADDCRCLTQTEKTLIIL